MEYTRTTTHRLDDFEIGSEPCEWIEPKIEVADDGLIAVLRYAVADHDPSPFEWCDVRFFQADRRYVSPHTHDEVLESDAVFQVERYEHGLVSYSLVADGRGYVDRQWDVCTVGVIGVPAGPEGYTNPREAAAVWLDEYTKWCNGDVYGVVEAHYSRSSVEDSWALVDDVHDSCWGYIGSDVAQEAVNHGL